MAKLANASNEVAAENTPHVPVMTGTHFHALDEKNRIIIPAKLRPALTERFWMILDDNDNISLFDYQTGQDVLRFCEEMMAEHPGDEDIAMGVERMTGAAEEVIVTDSSWRVQVPDILRYYAQLDKEVVTVGVLNHSVIWDRERWEEKQAARLQSPEARRAQAGMLRAAASGFKKKAAAKATELVVEEADVEVATGTAGVEPLPRSGRVKSASTSDGERSARVLTLSQLGR